jgi:hypothetical protein
VACTFTCDGCGKTAPGFYNGTRWFDPSSWYGRVAKTADGRDIEINACSRECIEKADNARGERVAILPI